MTRRALLVCGTWVLAWTVQGLAGAADANLKMVQRGWGGVDRAGRWNPLLIRASGAMPRNATLEWIAPQEAGFATVITERVAVGPTAGTFQLLAPGSYGSWDRAVLVLRDAESDKTLAQFPQRIGRNPSPPAAMGPQGVLVGISGRRASLQQIMRYAGAQTAYLDPSFLPRQAIGYDVLEVLFLDNFDLNDLDVQQQRAILDWVRAGGSLLLTPGDRPPPPDAALLAALPCRIGAIAEIDLDQSALKQAGLPGRFGRMTAHVLEMVEEARAVELLGNAKITAWAGRYGLGRVVVAPMDLGSLQFEVADERVKAPAFWKPILDQLLPPLQAPDQQTYSGLYQGHQSESEDQRREGAAISALCDFIDFGEHTSSTLTDRQLIVLILVLLVVGPVDWLVLRALGARPWTWSTSGGWISLIVIGAVFAGYRLHRQAIEYGTIRVIDQVDNTTIGRSDLVGIRSQRNGRQALDPIPYFDDGSPGWWRPVIPGAIEAPATPIAERDLDFHQNDTSNVPVTIRTSAGRARFLRSDDEQAGPPVLETSLSLTGQSGPSLHLAGTIRNMFGQPLKNIRVRTVHGVVPVPLPAGGQLAPNQIVTIDLPAAGDAFEHGKQEGTNQSYSSFGTAPHARPVNQRDLWAIAPDLAGRRSLRIDALVAEGDEFACIYAESVDPAPAARLQTDARPAARYYQWVRAVVPLKH